MEVQERLVDSCGYAVCLILTSLSRTRKSDDNPINGAIAFPTRARSQFRVFWVRREGIKDIERAPRASWVLWRYFSKV